MEHHEVVHGVTVPLSAEDNTLLAAEYRELTQKERRQYINRHERALAKTRKRLAEISEIITAHKRLTSL